MRLLFKEEDMTGNKIPNKARMDVTAKANDPSVKCNNNIWFKYRLTLQFVAKNRIEGNDV